MRDTESFSIGGVLGAGISIYFRNFPLFLILIVIAYVPYYLYGAWAPLESESLMGLLAESGVGLVCGALVQGALTYGVVTSLRGSTDVNLWSIGKKSLSVLPRIMLLSIVVVILVYLSALLLIVPGIIVAMILFVAVPASVMEGGGIGKALRRSAQLTKGNRWSLFVIGLVLIVPNLVATFFLALTVLPALGLLFGTILSTLVSQILFGGLLATCTAVAYHDLRILRDGVDTETIAAAFD